MTELIRPGLRPHGIVHGPPVVQCVAVADCKSLYDTITKERVMLLDKRLSLEAALLRQSLDEVSIKWVKSEQMLADCLTKVLPGGYARMVLTSNRWTLGPDPRAPSARARKLITPGRVETAKEAEMLNDAMLTFVATEA